MVISHKCLLMPRHQLVDRFWMAEDGWAKWIYPSTMHLSIQPAVSKITLVGRIEPFPNIPYILNIYRKTHFHALRFPAYFMAIVLPYSARLLMNNINASLIFRRLTILFGGLQGMWLEYSSGAVVGAGRVIKTLSETKTGGHTFTMLGGIGTMVWQCKDNRKHVIRARISEVVIAYHDPPTVTRRPLTYHRPANLSYPRPG